MFITINVGNTKTIISGFTSYDISSEVFSKIIPTNPLYEEELQKVFSVIKENVKEMPTAIGIAHTGSIDKTGSILSSSSYLPQYLNRNMVADIKNEYPNIPVHIENDSVCATIAETYYGEGENYDTVGLIYLSSGIGGSFLKKINTSYSIFEAEIGHQIIEVNGKACVCGQRGCLEAYVGAESIKRRFLMEQKDITDERIWKEIVECMAIGTVNLYTMFYPQILILSGETLNEVPYIREHLVERIRERMEWKPDRDMPIVLSGFGAKSPTYGALALIKIKEGGNTIKVIY